MDDAGGWAWAAKWRDDLPMISMVISMVISIVYPLVNIQKQWKDPPFSMGKSTISGQRQHPCLVGTIWFNPNVE